MDRTYQLLGTFLLLALIIFIFDYFFIKRKYLKKLVSKKKRSKKNEIENEMTELAYLITKFKLDKSKLPLNNLLIVISLTNACIISIVAVVVMLLDIFIIFQLVIGFILLIALIYSLYELIGRYLVKKGYGKNGF